MFNSSEMFYTFMTIPDSGDVIRADTITRLYIQSNEASGDKVIVERDRSMCSTDVIIPCESFDKAVALRDSIFKALGTNNNS
jgi:hypothetical protein